MNSSTSADTSKWPTKSNPTHSQAATVDLTRLASFLTELGYKVKRLEQRWRHVHGVIEQDGGELFFKLSSTREIGAKTANEVQWNKAVAEPLLHISNGLLVVPKIRRTGEYEGGFFYLSDFYTGEFPADHDPPRTPNLNLHISSLARAAACLNQLHIDSLWGKNVAPSKEMLSEQFFKDLDLWSQSSGRGDLKEIRALVEPLRDLYNPWVSHGDFVPWHVIIHGPQLVLIDGEHAWSGRPRYYDVAYFYHRVATSAARPDLAKIFLAEFKALLPKEEASSFDERFLPVIASRSLAGFYDATLFEDQKKVLDKHEQLRQIILSEDL